MRGSYNRSNANRGAMLETLIDMTNNQYRNGSVADVRKVPTPVKILKVQGRQVSGHLQAASWVDYSGVYNGKSIIFDAKETRVKNLPLKNVTGDQMDLLRSWHRHGATAFLIVAFCLSNEPEIYVLKYEQLESAWENMLAGGRKSIPLAFFQEKCRRVKPAGGYVVDYLAALS